MRVIICGIIALAAWSAWGAEAGMARQKASEPFVVQEGPVWRFGDDRLEVALDEGTLGLTVTPAGCAPWLTTAGDDEGSVAAADEDARRCALAALHPARLTGSHTPAVPPAPAPTHTPAAGP